MDTGNASPIVDAVKGEQPMDDKNIGKKRKPLPGKPAGRLVGAKAITQ